MKSRILDRPMFAKPIDESNVENVGIMQGFMDEMEAENELEMDEDYQTQRVLDRNPTSPEILMNNLRGDMRSVDARVEELADLVGYNAAMETPPDVLALLQPVLAAQQMPQGGIPMPPPGMPPMPPEGMPPEMMGGMPPMPPEGMPPMPPEGMPPMPPEMMGGMPPEAAMGGIGALPMDQGPMPPPVAMAAGGYVQSFRDGSDEEGVTPSGDTSSFPPGTFSPDEIEAARQGVLARLTQQPLPVPDLSAQTESRIPLYEKLLGADKNLSQAQILFELGQRAFNYGANVDDQGRLLRGSQAARLAGATRTLPGSMGNILAQQAQQDRAVRATALQASEKDIQSIRDQNVKLAESQSRLQREMVKTSAKTGSKEFGSSLEGIAQANLFRLAPEYAKGNTTEEQDRLFETSLTIATQPTQYFDPFTGNVSTKTPNVPGYVSEAIAERKKGGPRGTSSKIVGGQTTQVGGDVITTGGRLDSGPAPKAGSLPGRTLWNSADLITGPVSTGVAGVSRIPGLGSIEPEIQQARSFVKTAVNDLVANLRTNDRFNETERKELKNEIDISPAFFDSGASLRNRMIGISEFLDKKLLDANAQASDTTLPVNIRRDAADRATDLAKFKTTLGVPVRLYDLNDVKNLPAGTPFLWNGTEPRVKR